MGTTAEHAILRAPAGASEAERVDAGLAAAFATTALRYGATIRPLAARELSRWRARAELIPSASLRRLAHAALAKRGNMEGAALFAVLAPRARRAAAVRALVAVQAAYNYLDALAEQPSDDPVRNGRELHGALLAALDPDATRRDYYAWHPERDDGGYLAALVDASRSALAGLPSYGRAIDATRAAAQRVVEFQSLNLGERQGGCEGLARWARECTPAGGDLRWWETAAACGSSLGVHVLIGLAARSELDPGDLVAVDAAYHPTIGALHSLLDSLVDVEEDRRAGLRNLLAYYPSPAAAGERLARLTARACSQARALPDAAQHRAILTAMIAHYLSAPGAREPHVQPIARAVLRGGGAPLRRSLPAFRAAAAASRAARRAPA